MKACIPSRLICFLLCFIGALSLAPRAAHANRYYSPELGRFVSRDPIGSSAGIELYLFVRSNPTRYVDPLGLEIRVEGTTVTMDHPKGDLKKSNWNIAGLKEVIREPSQAADGRLSVSYGTYHGNPGHEGVTAYEFFARIKCKGVCEFIGVHEEVEEEKWYAHVLDHSATIRFGYDTEDYPAFTNDTLWTVIHEAVHVKRLYRLYRQWDNDVFLFTFGYKTKHGGPLKTFASKEECIADVKTALRIYELLIHIPGMPNHWYHAMTGDFTNNRNPTLQAIAEAMALPWGEVR